MRPCRNHWSSTECRDRIATITLNRPDKLNAVNDDMVRQIAAALSTFDIDNDAHVAILCGRGRAFSSGADVRQRQMRTREEFERHGGAQAQDASSHELLLRSVNWKPVIAAVHGYVLGLALGLVLDCDLIVAEAGTKFQVTETPRGLSGAKYWAMLNFRGGGAFATTSASPAASSPPRKPTPPASSNASHPAAPTWTRPERWPPTSRRTRRSACAPPSARAAGTWASSHARC